jgi:MFS family permease
VHRGQAEVASSFSSILTRQILVPSQPILAHWFDRRLSLAQGIAQAGSGVGALVFSNTTPLLLHHLGVKWTYIINGCISMAVLLPAAFLMKGRAKSVGAKNAPLQLDFFWHPGYRYYLVWAVLTSKWNTMHKAHKAQSTKHKAQAFEIGKKANTRSVMGYFIAIYTLASYCTNALGLSQAQGGAVQSILAAGQIMGRPFWGYLLDRGGRTNMVIVSYVICGIVTLAIWMPGRSFGLMALYGLINGATSGTIHMACTPLTASVVGVPDLASALAIYWLSLAIPNAIGQALAIMLVDYSKNTLGRTGADAYAISIGFCGALYLAGAVALIGVKHYLQNDWKVLKKA